MYNHNIIGGTGRRGAGRRDVVYHSDMCSVFSVNTHEQNPQSEFMEYEYILHCDLFTIYLNSIAHWNGTTPHRAITLWTRTRGCVLEIGLLKLSKV